MDVVPRDQPIEIRPPVRRYESELSERLLVRCHERGITVRRDTD